jgi:hypothetical protein
LAISRARDDQVLADAVAAMPVAHEEMVQVHAARAFLRPVDRHEDGVADQLRAGIGDQRADPRHLAEQVALELFKV